MREKENYPIPVQHLHAILVNDPDDAGRLDPSLAVNLYRYALLPQNVDLHRLALSYPVVLEVYQPRSRHLHGAENGDYLEDTVVEGRCQKEVAFFGAAPEVCAAHETKFFS